MEKEMMGDAVKFGFMSQQCQDYSFIHNMSNTTPVILKEVHEENQIMKMLKQNTWPAEIQLIIQESPFKLGVKEEQIWHKFNPILKLGWKLCLICEDVLTVWAKC